eukprot:51864-Eustigmatos_ZCMA.PRE.1
MPPLNLITVHPLILLSATALVALSAALAGSYSQLHSLWQIITLAPALGALLGCTRRSPALCRYLTASGYTPLAASRRL